ncbi:MAG: site-specific integrase [Bacteroidales bacterium]|jgi:integrase|nr:site-specific integrase [Bacteroidales bacterium]
MERKKPEIATAIILEKRVVNSENKHPVKLRITYNRKRAYYTIKNEYYTEDEFSKIYQEKARGNNKIKRRKFDSIEEKAIDIIDNVLKEFSFEAFKREFRNRKKLNANVKSYFEQKIETLNENDKIQTATSYQAAWNSLYKYDKKISFDKISSQYLKKYETWMLKEDNSYTTIGIYLRNFKHIINKAIEKGMPIEYPFGKGKDKYTIPKGNNIKKALTIDEVNKLFNYKPNDKNENLALKYWLFSYLCSGMNMIDIAYLKYKDIQGDNLSFIRQKTKDTSINKRKVNIYVMPETLEIIKEIGNEDRSPESYIFPIFNSEMTELDRFKRNKQHIKFINKYIKRIANKIGIDKNITTYWARHTYSTVLKRSNVSIEFISEQLGHNSLKVTSNYLDGFEDKHRKRNANFLLSKDS